MFGLVGIPAKIGEYLIVVLVVGAVALGIYHKGASDKENELAAEQLEAIKTQQLKYDKISTEFEEFKNKRQQNANTITREFTKVVEQPIYSTTCISDDGRVLINDAIAGRSASTSKSDPTLQTDPKP